jgi:hypothetical protein
VTLGLSPGSVHRQVTLGQPPCSAHRQVTLGPFHGAIQGRGHGRGRGRGRRQGGGVGRNGHDRRPVAGFVRAADHRGAGHDRRLVAVDTNGVAAEADRRNTVVGAVHHHADDAVRAAAGVRAAAAAVAVLQRDRDHVHLNMQKLLVVVVVVGVGVGVQKQEVSLQSKALLRVELPNIAALVRAIRKNRTS